MSDLRSKKCLLELAEAYRARAKKAETERDRLRSGIEKAYKVLLGISLQDGPDLGAYVDGYVDNLAILIEKIQKQAIKDLHIAEAERNRLRKALLAIKRYGDGNNGICPYGCDTPNIACKALEGIEG